MQPHVRATAQTIPAASTDTGLTTVFVASVHTDTKQQERYPQCSGPFVSIAPDLKSKTRAKPKNEGLCSREIEN